MPANFLWKETNDEFLYGTFKITVDISLNGLLRKFPLRLFQPFRSFLAEAIQVATMNQLFRMLTHKNYENLDFKETNGRFDKNIFKNNDVIKQRFSEARIATLSLISYRTTEWNRLLFERSRDADEAKFIKEYQ